MRSRCKCAFSALPSCSYLFAFVVAKYCYFERNKWRWRLRYWTRTRLLERWCRNVPCVVVFSVLYVVIAVALCLIAGGLLLFFLFPRTVNISSTQPVLRPTNIYLNVSAKVLFMTVVVCIRHITLQCYSYYLTCVAVMFVVSNITRKRRNNMHEIFREGVEGPWDDLIKFWINSGKWVGRSKVNLFVITGHSSED